MAKKNAWKVEPKLIDRFLDVLADNDFKWMSGHMANMITRPWDDHSTILFIEDKTKTLTYLECSVYREQSYEELDITEVTEELLQDMEDEGATISIVYDDPANPLYVGYKTGNISIDEDASSAIKYNESINHPSHDNHGGLETIDIIKALLTHEEYCGYLKGSFLKYREQAPYRGNTQQDYEKAKWYFDELMKVGNPSSICFHSNDFDNIVHEEEMM